MRLSVPLCLKKQSAKKTDSSKIDLTSYFLILCAPPLVDLHQLHVVIVQVVLPLAIRPREGATVAVRLTITTTHYGTGGGILGFLQAGSVQIQTQWMVICEKNWHFRPDEICIA